MFSLMHLRHDTYAARKHFFLFFLGLIYFGADFPPSFFLFTGERGERNGIFKFTAANQTHIYYIYPSLYTHITPIKRTSRGLLRSTYFYTSCRIPILFRFGSLGFGTCLFTPSILFLYRAAPPAHRLYDERRS
ncbi:hypothetical protein QBC46DRAFT_157214 [Diplogelasinospora grovesii]|uniref:Uncharacterized protein n=1 Tax=Diplogelasinospora grovesii TaxID=303347 RepID=A0AAN6NF42_9PEZI|nr:hypothetical protein QBC46DRAFT_157214 [Diplogelasinospora grovesii]